MFGAGSRASATPGKRTLTEQLPGGQVSASRANRVPSAAPSAPVHDPAAAPAEDTAAAHSLRAEGTAATPADVATAVVERRGAGEAVDPSVKSRTEAYLGADVGDVRVHGDPQSRAGAGAMGARAFAYGNDVFLGPGESGGDVELMAHELTHVWQQGSHASRAVQRAVQVGAAGTPAEKQADKVGAAVAGGAPPAQMIVDGSAVAPGQLGKDEFLAALKAHVIATADDALGRFGSAVGCPYIEAWFARHATSPARVIDALARRYSGVASPTSAHDYVAPVLARLRRGVERWKQGGDVRGDLVDAGLDAGLADAAPPAPLARGAAQAAPSAAGLTPAALVAELGPAERLDGATAARFSAATGDDVSGVRIHTGPAAHAKAGAMGAAAFTVGDHVAFADGQFAPGSPRGDALLAHELGHVAQQKAAGDAATSTEPLGDESAAHETDADGAAAGAMARLYGSVSGAARKVGASVRSGFQLQRCPSNAGGVTTKPKLPDAKLPAKLNTMFRGDMFEIGFSSSGPDDKRVLQVDLRYTGAHPARTQPESSNNAIALTRTLDQPLPIDAKVSSIDDTGFELDVFGNEFDTYKVHDRVSYDPALKARRHDFTGRMFGGESSGTVWVIDPKVAPISSPDDGVAQKDIPGQYPRVNPQGTDTWTIRFDADGDQLKESVLETHLVDRYPNGAPRSIQFAITQLASSTRVVAPDLLQMPPGDELFLGPSISYYLQGLSDGFGETEIGATTQKIGPPGSSIPYDPGGASLVAIPVPVRTASGVVYTLKGRGGYKSTVALPADKPGQGPSHANSASDPSEMAGFWTSDLTLGPYKDKFRLIVERRSVDKGQLIITPIQRKETSAGLMAEVALPTPSRLSVLQSDDLGVKLDLGVDGKPDVEIYTRVNATTQLMGPDLHPEENRELLLRVRGSAMPGGEQFYRFQNAAGSWHADADGALVTADDEAAMAADAVGVLSERKKLDTFQSQLDAYEAMMMIERKAALDEGLISQPLYDAWAALSTAMITLRPIVEDSKKPPPKGKPVDATLRGKAATLAQAFVDALAADTRGKVKVTTVSVGGGGASASSTTTSNEYTDTHSTSASVMTTTWGSGHEVAGNIRGGDWDKAYQQYNRVVGGFDKWIADQTSDKKGGKDPVTQKRDYMAKSRLAMSNIEGKKPKPVHAVFHPHAQYKPWESNLSRVPLALWYWADGNTWHLTDLSNPDRAPEVSAPRVNGADGQPEATPGRELFNKLNDKLIFPKGIVHYQVPGGIGDHVVCEEKKKWYEWVQEIAAVVALVGLGLATAGGAVAAFGGWVLAASALASGVASGADLLDRAHLGVLDNVTATLDVLNIIFAFAAFGAHGAGAIRGAAMKAASAGKPMTHFKGAAATAIGKLYLPLKGVAAGASGVTVLVLAGTLPGQIEAIKNGPGSDDEKNRAMALVITQFAVNFGMNFLSIKGDFAEFRKGTDLEIVMHGDTPVASLVGEADPSTIRYTRASVEDVGPGGGSIADATAAAKTAGQLPTRIDVVEIDGNLVTLDNKRLLSAQEAGLGKVKVVYHNPREVFPPGRAASEFVLTRPIYADAKGQPTLNKTDAVLLPKGHVARTYGEAVAIRSANQGEIKAADGTVEMFPVFGTAARPRVLGPGEKPHDAPEASPDADRPLIDNIDVENDLARLQTRAINTEMAGGANKLDATAKSKDDKVTFGDMYKRWIEGPEPVDLSGAKPRVKYTGDPAYAAYFEEFRDRFQAMLDAPGETLTLGARARAAAKGVHEADLASLDPHSPDYYTKRDALVKKLGSAAVERYETAVMGSPNDPARKKIFEQVRRVVGDVAITQLRNAFPGCEIYVTGSAAQASKGGEAALKAIADVDILLIPPAGSTGAARAKLEAEAATLLVPTADEFARATGKDALPVKATALAREEAAGLMSLDTAAGADGKPRTPLEYARVDAGAHELPSAHADELQTLGAARARDISAHLGAPLVRQLMTSGLKAAAVDAIAGAFTPTQVRGFLAEGLSAAAIGELATLEAATRAKLFGPGGLTGAAAHDLFTALGKPALDTLAKTLTGPEITALRTALGDDALFAKLAGVGGDALRDLVTALGVKDLKATAEALTPARFVELAHAGLTGPQLHALAGDFTAAQLTTLETVMTRGQLAKLYTAPDMGAPGLRTVHDCATNANIHGVGDWVAFEAGKGATQNWRNARGELHEAQRAVAEDPSEIVDVGGDAHAPKKTGVYSPRGTQETAPSFDQTVADARTGAIKRSVEITSVQNEVIAASDFTTAIKEKTQKLVDRATLPVDAPGHRSGTPLPIPGAEKELVIQIELFHGELDPATHTRTSGGGAPGTFPAPTAGRKSVVFDGRGGYRFQDHAASRPGGADFTPPRYVGRPNPGNVFTDMLAELNAGKYSNTGLLKRIRVVGFDGSAVALFENNGAGAWTKK